MVVPGEGSGEGSRGGQEQVYRGEYWPASTANVNVRNGALGPFPRRFDRCDRWKRGLSRTLLHSRCKSLFFCCAA